MPTDVSVIAIPRHLLKRWWSLAESGDDNPSNISAGFEGYAREVAAYFDYKNWLLPSDAVMEVIVSDGGQTGVAENDGAVVLQSSRATRFSAGVGTTLACINLGDENAAVFLGAESGAQSARIRVILEPGEGVMLPAGGIEWNRAALGAADVTVMLLIGMLSGMQSPQTANS